MVPDQDVEPKINCNAPISWRQLESLLQFRIDRARERLEAIGLDIAKTEAIRGEIKSLKNLLDLPLEATRNVEAPPHVDF